MLLHAILVVGYGAAAVMVGWLVPATPALRLLVGAVVFLGAALLHEVMARHAERRAVGRELAKLRKAQGLTAENAQRTQDSLADLQGSLGFGAGDGDLLGEMRTIRGLLKKMADRSAAVRE